MIVLATTTYYIERERVYVEVVSLSLHDYRRR